MLGKEDAHFYIGHWSCVDYDYKEKSSINYKTTECQRLEGISRGLPYGISYNRSHK